MEYQRFKEDEWYPRLTKAAEKGDIGVAKLLWPQIPVGQAKDGFIGSF